MEFKHEDWDKNCESGLLPCANIKNRFICLKCGYDSRGIEYSYLNENEDDFLKKIEDLADKVTSKKAYQEYLDELRFEIEKRIKGIPIIGQKRKEEK